MSGDDEVAPVQWSDNDISLWPGESETLHVRYRRAALGGSSPVATVSGWNVAPLQVPAH
jgi:exo-1,4-beta-D-glucosaminidase